MHTMQYSMIVVVTDVAFDVDVVAVVNYIVVVVIASVQWPHIGREEAPIEELSIVNFCGC